jgi:hypothetical protein
MRGDFLESVHAGNCKSACLLANGEFITLASVDLVAVRKPDYKHDHLPFNVLIGGWQVAVPAVAGRA